MDSKSVEKELEEKVLNMRIEELKFKSEKDDRKLNGHQYQLEIKRAYLFLQPFYLENLISVASKAYKTHYENRNWKFDEKKFEKFIKDFSTRKIGGTYFTSPAVAKYVREIPVRVKDLFEFGIDKIFDAKGVGNYKKNLFIKALQEEGLNFEETKKKFSQKKESLKMQEFDNLTLKEELNNKGVEILIDIPAKAFKKGCRTAEEIKSAFENYYSNLKEQLRNDIFHLDKPTIERRIKFIENQIGLYASIVDGKIKELQEQRKSSAVLAQTFEEFDNAVATANKKFHHDSFAPKQKQHLNPREKEIR